MFLPSSQASLAAASRATLRLSPPPASHLLLIQPPLFTPRQQPPPQPAERRHDTRRHSISESPRAIWPSSTTAPDQSDENNRSTLQRAPLDPRSTGAAAAAAPTMLPTTLQPTLLPTTLSYAADNCAGGGVLERATPPSALDRAALEPRRPADACRPPPAASRSNGSTEEPS